jgi:chorismate mutase/prephenate dehydratase
VPATLLGLRQTELRLVALLEVDTTLQLLSRAASAEAIAKVYATARDRAEARGLLSSLVPHAVVFDVATPLEACQRAAADPASGALGLEATGQLHELGVLGATSATPGHESHIRFCVASARPSSRTGKDATSLLFTVSDEPGALFEVLKHFAERGVNLRKIQSRPAEEDGLGYLFFVEVSGHLTDRNVVTALEGLKKQTKTLKILGSYPL